MKYIRDAKNSLSKFRSFRFPKIKFIFPKGKFSWRALGELAFKILAVIVLATAVLFIWLSKDLPDPNKLLAREVPQSTKIYDREGGLLYEIHGEYKRTLIPFSEMNENIKRATIAIEDKDFYARNSGISIKGLLRSAIVDIISGKRAQGGSTITQQFVRNAILTREKTFSRKIKEIILSLEINSRYSKDQILQLYLNEIPYGRNAYGIEAAAKAYFNKNAKDLDLAESAYLAAIVQSPSRYNPHGTYRSLLDARKNTVLQLMYEQKYITQSEMESAKNKEVVFEKKRTDLKAPHFVLYIEQYLANQYGENTLQTGGLKVTTTLDPKMQEIAEVAVKEGAESNATRYKAYNASLVAVDPKTGQILAMVGSKDYFGDPQPEGCKPGLNCYFESDVNVAISERQPGSSAKPYVYGTAFKPEFGQAPASLRYDIVTNFGTYGGKPYIPQNYNGQSHGPVSIRRALAGSLNIPAVKTLALIGTEAAVKTMRDFGITSPLQNCGLSLVLGGCEVKLLDHVGGFATFANLGVHNPTTGILKVEDSAGRILEEYKEDSKEVMDPQSAYLVTNILSDDSARSFIFGSGSRLTLPDRPVAAKTGTSQNFHDAWTIGYTPSLAAGVWVGNNDGTLMRSGADGVVVAAPIWNRFMSEVLKSTPVEAFTEPEGIQRVIVDSLTGRLPTAYTPSTKEEIFASFSVPKSHDNAHIVVAIDETTGQAPTEFSDPNRVKNVLYTVHHSERPDNPNWENPVVAWAISSGYAYPPAGTSAVNPTLFDDDTVIRAGAQTIVDAGRPPEVSIISPEDGAKIRTEGFTLTVNAQADTHNQITRVDLLIDGAFIQSLSSAPYIFNVNTTISRGQHVVAVHAVDDKGNSADTSIILDFK